MEDARLSRSAMIAITLLRVIVGWHFLYEGIAKLTSSSWSAAGYMRASRGPFAEFFRWIASQPQLLDKANLITMYGLTIVGALLVLGLFTRLAAVAGIGLILLFYLCNPPFVGYFYSIPTEGSYLIVNKNLVELCALAVVLVTGSGRFAGLDRIVHLLFARRPRLAAA
jgi:thiosulfate dehydrogenase [quinone] large subunit